MSLSELGWQFFPQDADLLAWVEAARHEAFALANDPKPRSEWLRHGGTWFAGVNLLPNEADGSISGFPLQGAAITAAGHDGNWDAGQVSICYPGYPRQDPNESDANHRFRKNRDAAHVDGLLPVGPDRRRFAQEFHGFVLGIPLTETSPSAAPMVVWEGSHKVMARAFAEVLAPHPPTEWPTIDLTDAYHAARRTCFDTCRRVEVHAKPGEAYLVHRLALHGVAPWADGAEAPEEGRVIVYFRPEMEHPAAWLRL